MSDQANPKLEAAESIFKSLLWDTTVEGLLAHIYASAPWLTLWPLKQVTSGLVTLATDKFYSILKTFVDVETISFVNAEHAKAYDSASLKLKVIALEKGVDSEEFRKAKDDAKAALSQLVRFGAST